MIMESFIALASNVALLLALVFVYDLVINRPLKLDTRLHLVMIGVGLGIIALAVMLIPWVFQPGITFDACSMLISISGLFFGAVPTVIVMVMVSILHIVQDGTAALTSICVIIVSGLIGLTWRRSFKRPLTSLTWRDLLGLGYTVDIAMLALMFTLPWQTALEVLSNIALPFLTIYPLATAALGALMINRLRHEQIAQALKDNEAKLQLLLDSTGEGIYGIDLQYRCTFCNASSLRLLGYGSAEELLGRNMHEQIHHSHADGSPFLADECYVVRSSRNSESRHVDSEVFWRADGSSFAVEYWSYPQCDSEGTVVGGVIAFVDITERKKAEKETRALNTELAESENQFHALFEQAALGVAKVEAATGRIVLVNQRLADLLGYTRDELQAMSFQSLTPPDVLDTDVDNMKRNVERLTSGDTRQFTVEKRYLRRDGSLIWANLSVSKLWRVGEQPGYAMAMIEDITERKRTEAEKETLQAQLLQAQKMEAIGMLAGGVAHDFNNLLTGILGNTAIMHSLIAPGDPLQEYLNATESSARQAADFTGGLLTFGRNAIVLPVPLNPVLAVETVLSLVRQSLPATMDIVRDFEPAPWNVLMDQSQMTQILLNLAINARDAMDSKGVLTVRIQNAVVDEEYVQSHVFARVGDFVRLAVADTGPGIPAEIRTHLFEPFFTTKLIGEGTGLGLSIVYGAVKQAGGWITAGSDPGTGAEFDMFLPRCLQEPRSAGAQVHQPSIARSGMILVVEDEPVVCAVAQALLTRSGYTVLAAPDGTSALRIVQEHANQLGLILLDMTMPGLTTDEILRGIRAVDSTVPILLNSGYTSNESVKRMLHEGIVQGFLGKPYESQRLFTTVAQLMRAAKEEP
jgi:two-component system cell cycle sensor histidine kinase/response regulator CckA